MKKFLVTISLILCVLLVFSSCNINNLKTLSGEKESEYIIKFEISNMSSHYVYSLTEDNKIFAYYEDEDLNFEEIVVELTEFNLSYMNPYIEKVLTLKEDEIEGFVHITDFWRVTLYCEKQKVEFDYGASKSTDVNILLEQVIGCCNFKKNKKEKNMLLPIGSYCRNIFEEYNQNRKNQSGDGTGK